MEGRVGGAGWRGGMEGRRDGRRDQGGMQGGMEGRRDAWRDAERAGSGGRHGGTDGEEERCGREARRAGSGRVADSTIAWRLTAGTATTQSRVQCQPLSPGRGITASTPVPQFPQHPAPPCLAPGGQSSTQQHTAEPRPAVGTAAVSPWQELEDSRRGRVWGQTDQEYRDSIISLLGRRVWGLLGTAELLLLVAHR